MRGKNIIFAPRIIKDLYFLMKSYYFPYLLSLVSTFCSAQSFVEPLVSASWKQTSPFNNECPSGTRAGCGAIAVSQILNYYKSPSSGFGVATDQYGQQIDVSDWTIDWDNILNEYKSGNYNEKEASAVAKLVHLTGLSMGMNYGSSSSPKNNGSMMWGMQHNLHISPNSRYLYRRNYSTAEWKSIIDSQLDAGHPVFYRGTYYDVENTYIGHMFVIDGRNEEGLYHVNFGHANKNQDKYVDLDYINQSNDYHPGGANICYNHQQAMVINCYPVAGLSDEAYEGHPMILDQTFIINNDVNCLEYETTIGNNFSTTYKLRDCSFTAGEVFFELAAFSNNEMQFLLTSNRHKYTYKTAGGVVSFTTKYAVPAGTPSGSYELSLVYRHNENEPWKKCWSNAPNTIKMTVSGSSVTLYPSQNFIGATLRLSEEAKEVGDFSDGKTFELKLENNSVANYEDTLLLRFSVDKKIYEFKHTSAIYEGCTPVFHVFVPYSQIPLQNSKYTLETYYYDSISGNYVILDTQEHSDIVEIRQNEDKIVDVYNLSGYKILSKVLYSDCKKMLNKGTYIIKGRSINSKITVK